MPDQDIMKLLDGSSALGGMQNLLMTIVIPSIILTVLLLGLFIYNTISRIRSERAMVAMQKDIKVIREALESQIQQAPKPNEPILIATDETHPSKQSV